MPLPITTRASFISDMRKFIFTILIAVASFMIGITAASFTRNKSLLKDEYLFYQEDNRYCGFYMDTRTNLVGIVYQNQDLIMKTPAIFEDCYMGNSSKTQMLIVKKNGKWGAYDGDFESDTYGEFTVPFIYDSMRPFDSNDHAVVTLNGETFKIDKYNNKVSE